MVIRHRAAAVHLPAPEASGGQYSYGYGNLSGAVECGTLRCSAWLRTAAANVTGTIPISPTGQRIRTGDLHDGGRAGFFDLQAGWQDRDFGSNGFYAAYNPDQWEHTATALGSLRWLKTAGRFSLGAAASYRKNFDRYDWTRGTAMNRHNTDNVGAKLWADCDWAAGVTTVGGDYAFNHIYSTNLGDKLSVPEGHYTHAKARHTGNLYCGTPAVAVFDAAAFWWA